MTTKAILSYDNRVRIFWTLATVCVALLALYVYGVNATVRNTAEREDLESETSNLAASLSEKEFTYIALKNDVSLDLAYQRGFKDVQSPIFISRTGGLLGLNMVR